MRGEPGEILRRPRIACFRVTHRAARLFARAAKIFLAALQSFAIGCGRQNHANAPLRALHWQS
jgi:hypothetical protein